MTSSVGWGEALWDRFDAVQSQTSAGIETSNVTKTFFAKLAEVEKEYAIKLSNLCKTFAQAPPNRDTNQNFRQVWDSMIGTVGEISSAHNNFATTVSAEVSQKAVKSSQVMGESLSQATKTYQTNEAALTKAKSEFAKAKKVYDKIEKNAENAKAALDKAEKHDPNNREKLNPYRRDYASKAKAREEGERNLQESLNKLNAFRTNHFYNEQRVVMDTLQAGEQERSETIVTTIKETCNLYLSVNGAEKHALEALSSQCEQFDKVGDTLTFMNSSKSGQPLPGDLQLSIGKKQEVVQSDKKEKKHKREKSETTQATQPQQQQRESAPPPPPPQAAKNLPKVQLMYDFPGSNPGEIGCHAGEVVVLHNDSGDGWMLVAKSDGSQGYIPSSYTQKV
eukprot:m.34133 g.34133  ORF g.34133 m.34133 type:complete len:393 (-) comp9905_c0_seq1:215-1393(-)